MIHVRAVSDSVRFSCLRLGLQALVIRWPGSGVVEWSGVSREGNGGVYVKPVERLTPARKAEKRTASKA